MRPSRTIFGSALLLTVAPILSVAAASPAPPTYIPDLEPPNPVAGECYARVEIPARYETITENVLTREAHHRLLVQPPQLESRTERVMVKEPSVRYVVRQPTYKTVNQTLLTRPAYDKLNVSEPQFQTVTETVKKGRSRLIWKRGHPATLRAQGYVIHSTADGGVGGKGYASTTQYAQQGGQRCGTACEIWCLVEEPGESVTVTRQVLTHPGQVHRTPVAAQYETITKQVVADPGGVEKIPVPAEYRNVQVQKIVKPGATAKIDVPAEYGQVQGRRLVSEARYEWRRIACKPGVPQVSHQKTYHQTVRHQQTPTIIRHQPTVTRSHISSSTHPVRTQTHHRAATPNIVSAGGSAYTPLTSAQPAYPSSYQASTVTSATSYGTHHTGVVPSGDPIERSADMPDRAYNGPAYAIPHTGDSHPYAVRPGAPKRQRSWIR